MGFKNHQELGKLNPMYHQAPENTLDSLVHGMALFDAIEFDVRLTKDDQVIIHHDRKVSINPELRHGKSPYVENRELDELLEMGFCSLEMLLEHPLIQQAVQEQGKVMVIESKRPSYNVKRSGGWFAKNKHDIHMGATMKRVEEVLDQYDIPQQSTVHYAFHKSMKDAARLGGIQRNWSTLLPTIRPFGGRKIHRILASPEFLTTSFARLMKKHQRNASPMMPCAIEYLTWPTNRIPLGKTVGLRGKSLERLTKIRQGFPVYLWPVSAKIEHAVLNAGLSVLTDASDPAMTWLPSGHARWTQPATLPLDETQYMRLKNATKEDHLSVLKSIKNDVTPWMECDVSRKRELLAYWRQRWQWNATVEDLLDFEEKNGSMPWQIVRMIGHRGAGKTKRPVL
ncbi:MAG: glycerophosphodiester phosphodiesterase family protein [Candidatus Poseidoniaceae archaeon]|nr:glycerophosphodiester phosphodiesterase family protein [Candidatus Poseidoniaceae archaeon]